MVSDKFNLIHCYVICTFTKILVEVGVLLCGLNNDLVRIEPYNDNLWQSFIINLEKGTLNIISNVFG
jgi:hypothetical protein